MRIDYFHVTTSIAAYGEDGLVEKKLMSWLMWLIGETVLMSCGFESPV